MAQFISDDDNAICILEDALELVYSFKIVDFSKDSDLVSGIGKCVLDLLYILDRCNTWYQDVIKVVLDGDSDDIVLSSGYRIGS